MTTNPICIAPDLCMPLEVTTQTLAILAKRGVGKTYTASVLTEELLKAGSQVIVLDPLDSWWGLRSSADGEGPGHQILVLGGQHGDLPLDATNGTILAELVVEEHLSVILSLRHLSKTAQRRFVAEFCERLYHVKGEDRHRLPLHVVIDEADAFVPQRVAGDTARVMGAVDDLVRRGRSSGIGVTLITQRASVIHKDVLTQLEVLIALRTVSPQDRKAIESWIEAHDPEDRGAEVLASLASLPVGTAWVWSPGWLDLLQKVTIRKRETFDSSSTPKVGAAPVEPRTLATVDLDAIRDKLATTIERAANDDPTTLKRRIAELERQARQPVHVAPVEPEVRIEYREHPGTARAIRYLGQRLASIQDDITSLMAVIDKMGEAPDDVAPAPSPKPTPIATPPPVQDRIIRAERSPVPSNGALRKGERKMLQALATLDRPITRIQLGTLAGFAPAGGTFGQYLSNLKRHEYAVEDHGGLTITDAGLAILGDDVPTHPQSTADLIDLWRGNLRAGERRMLDALVECYPAVLSREELGEATGFATSGGTFGQYLSTLRRNGLADIDGAQVRASDALFLS